ncbi:hypothetical protein DRQ25_13430, partial [Candidatus Fermentibacteria bacterium]
MPRRLTTEEWVAKAVAKWGDAYDYSETVYTGATDPVTFRCRKSGHGYQTMQANNHLSKQGCRQCTKDAWFAANALSFESFSARVEKLFGGLYECVESTYTKSSSKLTVICKLHGEFYPYGSNLLRGSGCPTCGIEKIVKSKTKSFSEFYDEAYRLYLGQFSYDEESYTGAIGRITFTCPGHGESTLLVSSHLTGKGCRSCAAEIAYYDGTGIHHKFVAHCRAVHGDRYEILSPYRGEHAEVLFRCKLHGEYWQMPRIHLAGVGCRGCADAARAERRATPHSEFMATLTNLGPKITVVGEYTRLRDPIEIYCDDHGTSFPTALLLKTGHGCVACGRNAGVGARTMSSEEFERKSKEIHGDAIEILSEYVNMKTKLLFKCPVHGEYSQTAEVHLTGTGCPTCAGVGPSKEETALADFIADEIGPPVERGRRDLMNGSKLELDIFIPSKKLAIEYNGLIFHSTRYKKDRYYHANKTKLCDEAGIRLVHIPSDMWTDEAKQAKTKNYLRALLGNECISVGARKCRVVDIDSKAYRKFCDTHHLMRTCVAGYLRGLEYRGELIAVVGVRRMADGSGNLVRYAVDQRYKIPGGLARLCKGAVRPLITFCDLSVFTGGSYEMAGFKAVDVTAPDLWYTNGVVRENRRNFQKPRLASRFGAE